jgi:magnesium chelatase subunit D
MVKSSKDKHGPRPQARALYPFSAIVGQEEMKLALLLSAIDSNIGGVIIMGHRGTAKSTAVRGLADLLPALVKVKGCRFGCDPNRVGDLCKDCAVRAEHNRRLASERGPVPVVDLPLGATEDRICGTLDIERALVDGVKSFEPGLLARANRGFLYIDEVNLLEDHLVDVLLDAAASGYNVVEREGVSLSHPARFVLVGSGNPEEGDLRPQLLDRFGLFTEIATITDLDLRVEIVRRREHFERDPEGFRQTFETEQARLRKLLARARRTISRVAIDDELLRRVAELCVALEVDGHRGELTIARAARSLAAFNGRRKVGVKDVRLVAVMALRHRLRKDPLDRLESALRIEQALDELFPETEQQKFDRTQEESPPDKSHTQTDGGQDSFDDLTIKSKDAPAPGDLDQLRRRRSLRASSGRHLLTTNFAAGRYVRSISRRPHAARVAVDATLREAAPHQSTRRPDGERKVKIAPADLRYKALKRKTGILFVFVVDASASMAVNRMAQAKGALTRLLERAYLHRDKVALVAFRGEEAQVLLPPTRSVSLAKRLVDSLPAGGATPLGRGLLRSLDLARAARAQDRSDVMLVVLTDGRANVGLGGDHSRTAIGEELGRLGALLQSEGIASVVIDTKSKFVSTGEGRALAGMLGGKYVYLPLADSSRIYDAVSSAAARARARKSGAT